MKKVPVYHIVVYHQKRSHTYHFNIVLLAVVTFCQEVSLATENNLYYKNGAPITVPNKQLNGKES
jgi:hypothetical protein